MGYRLVEPTWGEMLETVWDSVNKEGFESSPFEVVKAYSVTKLLFNSVLARARELKLVTSDYAFEDYDKFILALAPVEKAVSDIIDLFNRYEGEKMNALSLQESLIVFPKALLALEKIYKNLNAVE